MRHLQTAAPGRAAVPRTAADWIALYLEEDLDEAGDVTSDAVFPPDREGSARLVARERAFLAGVGRAAEVFEHLGAEAEVAVPDGRWVEPGTVVLRVRGLVRALLAAERTALNLLGRMCGVASLTRAATEALEAAGAGAEVAGTRKTTPGFRFFEKEAIRVAGGDPHRDGLYDAAMVKDNHREAAGDLRAAVRAVCTARPHPDFLVEVEVESEADAVAAAQEGADWVLIDNQDPETGRAWAEAVRAMHSGIRVEASGGIPLERVVDHGWADRVSLGALTRDAKCLDFGLDWGEGP